VPSKKARFRVGFAFLVFAYSIPVVAAILFGWILGLTVFLAGFLFSVSLLYWLTIKRTKPRYPLVPPEGHPDIYTFAGMPRPIHEDMKRYPWLFDKKRKKHWYEKKKIRKSKT